MSKPAWDAEELPTGEAKQRAVREMFDTVAPRYDLVNRIMTMRLDVRWRRQALDSLGLQQGSRVLDPAYVYGEHGALTLKTPIF